MSEITLPSGRTLLVTIAPFSAANKFRKVMAKEMLSVDLDLGGLTAPKDGTLLDLDLTKLPPEALSTIKNLFCTLLASDAIEACFWECAQRCTIDGAKVDKNSFDPAETRADFLPCAWEVMKTNVPPFFESLGLSSLISGTATKSAPQ